MNEVEIYALIFFFRRRHGTALYHPYESRCLDCILLVPWTPAKVVLRWHRKLVYCNNVARYVEVVNCIYYMNIKRLI